MGDNQKTEQVPELVSACFCTPEGVELDYAWLVVSHPRLAELAKEAFLAGLSIDCKVAFRAAKLLRAEVEAMAEVARAEAASARELAAEAMAVAERAFAEAEAMAVAARALAEAEAMAAAERALAEAEAMAVAERAMAEVEALAEADEVAVPSKTFNYMDFILGFLNLALTFVMSLFQPKMEELDLSNIDGISVNFVLPGEEMVTSIT